MRLAKYITFHTSLLQKYTVESIKRKDSKQEQENDLIQRLRKVKSNQF